MERSAIRLAATVEYERSLAAGRGAVMVAVDDPVEPEGRIAQGPGGGPPILAGLRGRVRRVLPERGAIIGGVADVAEGVAGFGPPAVGPLIVFAGTPSAIMPGAVVVIPGELTGEVLAIALSGRASGIFAASAQPQLIESLLGTECSALLDGSLPPMNVAPLGIVLAHGFGTQPLRGEYLHVINSHLGQAVLMMTQTNLTQQVRPALVLPLPWQSMPQGTRPGGMLAGAHVWVTGGPHHGAAGRIMRVLTANYVFPSGIRAPAARLKLEGGPEVTLPLANLQPVG
ncbi:MAG: hypothetical protein H0X24_11495 [Ktedonobacterales bacterium]|nr:hypothetical protein [Ktedonobacterales bacterium]